jgi:hypothetical protein
MLDVRLVYVFQPKGPDQGDNALETCTIIRGERIEFRLRLGVDKTKDQATEQYTVFAIPFQFAARKERRVTPKQKIAR